ncbi:MAG: tRNA (adenosine(37)-N6)-dimethylallyltransferase MiaA [Bacteroidales bacterium]|nr:tRNA (adenosine(37)-N6)-dimethylallyltransferase MiaA [Bacteroidales bacterium]
MKQLIIVAGPTAVGKTAYAIELARKHNTEIVSCDSRQFYSELNIGVARPSADELNAVPHHFIACRSAKEPYNVYDYEHDAMAIINTLFQHHDVVVAVGGSGLYIDSLVNGINYMPDPAPGLREKLSNDIAEGKLPQLLDELSRLDPEYYAIVDRNNPIRIQRALEVIITSGRTYTSFISKPLQNRDFDIKTIVLERSRDELRDRINRRVDQMIDEGLVDEVKSLIPLRGLNTLNTVGYKELFDHFDGKCSIAEAVEAIKSHTWQYARKQLNWMKRYL